MAVTIKTDHKWKAVLSGFELPKKWRKEFSYLTNDQYSDVRFAYYNKYYYDVQEFMVLQGHAGQPKEFKGWDGYQSDSYFSGIVIKISSDGEKYKIGRYYQTGD